MSASVNIPGKGAPSFRYPVSTSTALPSTGNNAGDLIVTQDTGIAYGWTGSAWVAQGTGGSGGTVTNVTGTSPIVVASGTTTPALSIIKADATHNGYLSSTDWSTFNSKQNLLLPSTRILYVSSDTGNDSTGDGSFGNQFATIQKGINVATAFPSTYNTPIVVAVAPSKDGGTYTENLTISQQGIILTPQIGVNGRADQILLFGSITINLVNTPTGYSASLNNFAISGFQIAPSSGNCIIFSGSVYQRLFLSNCIIGQNTSGSAISCTNTGSSSGSFSTITIRDCDLQNNSGSNATIVQSAGKIFIAGSNPSITNATAAGPAITQSGASTVNLTLNNGSITGLYLNSGVGTATFTNTSFTSGTNTAILTLSSTGSVTLGVTSVTNTTSTGSGISNAGGTVTVLQTLFNIGTGTGAYVIKGTGVYVNSLNAFVSNTKYQNTLTFVPLSTTPTSAA